MPARYTAGEIARLARLEFKAARRVIRAGDENAGGNDHAQKRIHDRAQERWAREANAALDQLETAEKEVARAKAAMNAAKPGRDRDAARRAHSDAKAKARRAESAARKYR